MASSSSSSRTLKIGIIGFGPFGQFLAKTMMKQGHVLRATSRTDYSQLCHQLGISFFRDIRAFLEADNNVILISTSILSLSQVLKSSPVHCIKRPTLIADVLSVKEYLRNVLLQEIDVLCTHPMFGPQSGKNGWKDLAFVYERVGIRDEATCYSYLHIFEREGCKMLEMSCEEHDKVAAWSQFLTQHYWQDFVRNGDSVDIYETKGFNTLIRLTESSVWHSFDLFSGLFIHNRFAKQERQNLQLALEKVKQRLRGWRSSVQMSLNYDANETW